MSRPIGTPRREDDGPWYRQRWPWLLMAGPAIVVVAGFVTAWLAATSSDGLVEDDYYKQGLAVDKQLQRVRVADERRLAADLVLGGSGRELRLFLSSAEGVALPERLFLRFVHPTRSGADQSLELRRDASGYYTGSLTAPISGRWRVQIEDERREWRLAGEWKVGAQESLHLGAAAPR